jgi:CheY-like chemotaxis protein
VKPVAGALRGNGETILVVEDEDGIRELVEVTLGGLGYNVLAAPDGPTALHMAREHARIDLLLTDIMLPKGMNGYQVVEELEKARPGLRVLFASGYSEEFAKTPRRHKLLMKPYGSAELSEAVYKALH